MKHNVTFQSSGLTIAAHLYIPENVSAPLPAVVIGHPMGSVKEQSPANYAERLLKKGFVVLTYDAAYQGDSEGFPRGLEDPFQRAEDVKSAVSFLTTRAEVDADRIGAIGICASGGYVPFAAQTDHRIKAVATVVGACVGILWRDGMDGKQSPDVIQHLLTEAAIDRTNEAKGEPARVAPIVPETEEQAKQLPEKTMFREAYYYYRTPIGQHPRSTNRWVTRSVDKIAQYDSYAMVGLIAPRPLLMITGSEADTQRFSVETIAKAKGEKELFIIDGATHIDFYYKPEYIDQAVAKLDSFFKQHLA